jgi:hypothetical protein
MARSKSKELGTSASRKPAKTMARAKDAQSQDQQGSKSWTFVDGQKTAAGVRSFTSVNGPKTSSEPTLKSQLVAHFAERPVESSKVSSGVSCSCVVELGCGPRALCLRAVLAAVP